jgi:hypothetical protein
MVTLWVIFCLLDTEKRMRNKRKRGRRNKEEGKKEIKVNGTGRGR